MNFTFHPRVRNITNHRQYLHLITNIKCKYLYTLITSLVEFKFHAIALAWTVKGIETETRIAVQKAAKKEGKTLGQYCNIKLREAAHNTLKIGNDLLVQPEDIREEVKTQINALKEDLPEIVKLALAEMKPEQISLFKRIFG